MVYAASGCAGVVILGAIPLLVALLGPTEAPARAVAAILPLAHVQSAIADQALAKGNSPVLNATADAATRTELRQAPGHAGAWLRLAYLESLKAGTKPAAWSQTDDDKRPDAKAQDDDKALPVVFDDLARSYTAAPLDTDLSAFRLTYILNHWSEAPVGLRRHAMAEVEGVWQLEPRRQWLRELPMRTKDQKGQLALLAKLTTLSSPDAEPSATSLSF